MMARVAQQTVGRAVLATQALVARDTMAPVGRHTKGQEAPSIAAQVALPTMAPEGLHILVLGALAMLGRVVLAIRAPVGRAEVARLFADDFVACRRCLGKVGQFTSEYVACSTGSRSCRCQS